jgi:triosephosphate isomerase
MSSRTPIIAGNWKMNKTVSESVAFVREFMDLVGDVSDVDIVLCPPFTSLKEVKDLTEGTNIRTAAQNMHFELSGAYTGEISAAMLTDIGVTDVVLGHSERREFFAERDTDLARKVKVAFEAGLRPILCVGESAGEREAGKTEEKLQKQLVADLAEIDAGQLAEMVVAYEPIWAIGTGKTATPQIAQETIKFIRTTLEDKFGSDAAAHVRILYGGSVKPDNVDELMAEEDIDGALVGGACLAADDFARIVMFQ